MSVSFVRVETTRLTFDLETRALPEEQLFERFNPEFKPRGNLTDPNKIKADLLAKRQDWLDESTLRAERSQILALGFTTDAGETVNCLHGENEVDDILRPFLDGLDKTGWDNDTFLEVSGFNILDFDLPFFRRRCILNRVPFPFYNAANRWHPWTFKTFDAMVDWQCGTKREPFVSLETLGKALGICGDLGDWKEFVPTYAEDKEKALDYVRGHVRATAKVIEAMKI